MTFWFTFALGYSVSSLYGVAIFAKMLIFHYRFLMAWEVCVGVAVILSWLLAVGYVIYEVS